MHVYEASCLQHIGIQITATVIMIYVLMDVHDSLKDIAYLPKSFSYLQNISLGTRIITATLFAHYFICSF
jgi:hypothetical protein